MLSETLIVHILKSVPAIKLQEKVATLDGDGGDLWCTACEKFFVGSEDAKEWNFCPNWGARFKEEPDAN